MKQQVSKESTHEIKVRDFDVLCGRGGFANNHPGNKLFRCIIRENKGIYHELSEDIQGKRMLVSSIIKAIEHHGGRFLRKTTPPGSSDGHWVEISHKAACSKTSQALREQDPNSTSSTKSLPAMSSATSAAARPTSPLHSKFRQALRVSSSMPWEETNQTTDSLDVYSMHDSSTSISMSSVDTGLDDIPELAEEVSVDSFDDLILDLESTIEGNGTLLPLTSDYGMIHWTNNNVESSTWVR
eukprot:Nitzschia sp. Nitz4//scaffold133_size116822//115273//115995//NITZ4_003830-RA/size116822-processed-gene-0.71-mRNA-1//-1//CDS//3329535465//6384//frame0